MTANALGWHDVVDYGALPNGVLDNTPAFLAASQAAGADGTVYVCPAPGGLYRTGARIDIPYVKQKWIIPHGATIKPLDNASASRPEPHADTGKADGFAIFGITGAKVKFTGDGTIDCNKSHVNLSAFDFECVDDFTVDGLSLTEIGYFGVYARNCNKSKIRNLKITKLRGSSLYSTSGIRCQLDGPGYWNDLAIEHNEIDHSDNPTTGYDSPIVLGRINTMGNGRIIRPRINWNKCSSPLSVTGEEHFGGIQALANVGYEIEDAEITYNTVIGGFEGLGAGSLIRGVVGKNSFLRNGRYGIESNDCLRVKYLANTIDSPLGVGMSAYSSTGQVVKQRNQIIDNTFVNPQRINPSFANYSSCVIIANSDGNDISHNAMYTSTQYTYGISLFNSQGTRVVGNGYGSAFQGLQNDFLDLYAGSGNLTAIGNDVRDTTVFMWGDVSEASHPNVFARGNMCPGGLLLRVALVLGNNIGF